MVQRNGKAEVILSRLPAILKETSKTWRMFTSDCGDLIWISSEGEARSADAVRDIGIDLGLLTVEESLRGHSPLEGFPVAAAVTSHAKQENSRSSERCTIVKVAKEMLKVLA